jgi:hypothetical protein
MRFDTLRSKVIARAIAQVDRMSPDELLGFVNRPLFKSEQREGCATLFVRAHAMRRLDATTS